jgi:hypothetical protein
MHGVTDKLWSHEMSKRKDASASTPSYVLSEEGHAELAKMRDQLFLVANFVMASTQEEDEVPLQLWRNVFGKWLDDFAEKIDAVLIAAEGSRRMSDKSLHTH